VHRVLHASGPERIEGEWWREDAPVRDYYRIEDSSGARFWLYRAGAYDAPAGAMPRDAPAGAMPRDAPAGAMPRDAPAGAMPRWYLHGLFG
jgi:hypothetical protein